MSRAPASIGLDDEVRLLSESKQALEAALVAAQRGRDTTQADLVALRRRLAAKTEAALPHDPAICQRITSAIQSACAAAGRALTERWDEIVRILRDAYRKVSEELARAETLARRRAVR